MLGLKYILCIYGRTFNQRPSRSKKSSLEILSMGAIYSLVSGFFILHTTFNLESTFNKIRSKYCKSRTSSSFVSKLGEVSRSRQDHVVHDQIGRSILVYEATSKRRRDQEMRLWHTTVVFHGRVVLLLYGLEFGQHRQFFKFTRCNWWHISRLPLLFNQNLLFV